MSDDKSLLVPMRRRTFLGSVAAATAALSSLGTARVFAQEPKKPAEIIVRAWGGSWLDSLKQGVSDPFTAMTGIAVRYDLTEDNEIQPKLWAAAAQKRVPPIHVNWDTTTNATKSALRGVTEDLADLPNLKNTTEHSKPKGFAGYPLIEVYGYAYLLAYRPAAFPDGPPKSWKVLLEPRFKGRLALYNDGIGFHFPAQIAGGGKVEDIPDNMQAAWDFITKVKAQQPLLGEDPDFTAWFQKGEIDVACTILTNVLDIKRNGIEIAWTIPEEGVTFNTDSLWIPQYLPENELYWAKQYINQALTLQSQQVWLAGLGLPGFVPGVTAPAELVGDPAYPTKPQDYERMIQVPARVQATKEREWFSRYKEIMQS